MNESYRPPAAPEAWIPAQRMAARVLGPVGRFLHVEAASGIVLLVAALAALIWANSPWAASYEHLWHTPITFGIGTYKFTESVHFWINDGLMVIFFFVVGLEIRREIHSGELSDLKRATLPIAAALGGMAAPALIYLSLNPAGPSRQGWGVPTATDIAFAVGVLALLGKRVPAALRVLLLALAIIDDIGAIIVIALFYSSGVSIVGLVLAAGGVGGVFLLQRFGVRHSLAYVVPGSIIWLGMLRAGIHPTIGGVVLGLLTPARSWFGESGFLFMGQEAMDEFKKHSEREDHRADDLLPALAQLREARREALPPVIRIQAALHPWVAYGIMPLFALANAGVSLRGIAFDDPTSPRIMLGIILGLVIGKPLGILLASFITTRIGIAAMPRGVSWGGILLVGCVAGIGFTMAIFIANLAFPGSSAVGSAKLAVLIASLIAAVIGLVVGRAILSAAPVPGAAATADEAERSTDQ